MKPQQTYFTVDLTKRPLGTSKSGAVRRAFEVAARDVLSAATKEGSLPDEVLVMVMLAPKPVLSDKPEAKPEAEP